jgi:hypothetical protein
VLAGGNLKFGFFAYNILPESPSNTIAALEEIASA